MRYRNRIKIAPGLNINLSKTGVSATFGPRGANVNIGKQGAYLNTGIPGTGLYNRNKISDLAPKKITPGPNQTAVNVGMDLDENYEIIIEITDKDGKDLTTQAAINQMKRKPEYKQTLLQLYKNYHDKVNKETYEFTELHKLVIKPISDKEVQEKIKTLKLKKYTKIIFSLQKPMEESIKQQLEKESKEMFNSILFWKNKKRRKDYVSENLDINLNSALKDWTVEKNYFIESEIIKEKSINKQFQKEYEDLNESLNGISDFVILNFETILDEIDIKPEFFVDFDYDEKNKEFNIDLDLPEIEHLPTKKATLLKSGKISVKEKSLKQLNEEYAQCVSGLAFLIGGIAFMSSVAIDKVNISAYTQRIDKKDGYEKNDYIYSINFDRDNFSKINYKKIDPLEALSNFENKMAVSKSFIFKTIDPTIKC